MSIASASFVIIGICAMGALIIADVWQRRSAAQEARTQQLRDFHDSLKASGFPMDADALAAFEASVRKGRE